MHRRVEQEGVDSAVPGDVYETDQPPALVRRDPAQAAGQHPAPHLGVFRIRHRTEGRRVQGGQLREVGRNADQKFRCQPPITPISRPTVS